MEFKTFGGHEFMSPNPQVWPLVQDYSDQGHSQYISMDFAESVRKRLSLHSESLHDTLHRGVHNPLQRHDTASLFLLRSQIVVIEGEISTLDAFIDQKNQVWWDLHHEPPFDPDDAC